MELPIYHALKKHLAQLEHQAHRRMLMGFSCTMVHVADSLLRMFLVGCVRWVHVADSMLRISLVGCS